MQRYEKLVDDLEKDFAVETLKYRGHYVWPFFRISLLYHRPAQEDVNNVGTAQIRPKKSIKARIGDFISALENLRYEWGAFKTLKRELDEYNLDDCANEAKIRKAEVVFFYFQLHRNQNINGAYSNLFLDPLLEEIQSRYNCIVLEDIEHPNKAKRPRLKPSVIISKELKRNYVQLALKKVLSNFILLFPFAKEKSVEGFETLSKHLPNEIRTSIYKSDSFLIYQMDKILALKETLVKILKQIEPKVLVQTSFYHPLGLAVNMACAELGIKSVEVQHGVLEPLAYWNFNKEKVQHFNMLPEYFWLWEADSARTINAWISDKNKVVVGGNIWMKKMLKREVEINSKSLLLDKKMKDFKYKILYSMQPAPFNTFPSDILDAIEENTDVFWLIRVHPRLSQQDIPLVKNLLNERGINNFEIELASELTLVCILQKVNLHITKFSAVVFDSALINIPTIFIDKYAEEVYSRDYPILWNSAIIRLALDKSKLVECINFFRNNKVSFVSEGYFGNDDYLKKFDVIASY